MKLRPLTSPFMHTDSNSLHARGAVPVRCHATQQPVGSEDESQLHNPYESNIERGALTPRRPAPPVETSSTELVLSCRLQCTQVYIHAIIFYTWRRVSMEPLISGTFHQLPFLPLLHRLQSVMQIRNAAVSRSRSSFSETGN